MIKIDASRLVPKRLGTYLLGLIPGMVFELSVAFGDPLMTHQMIERVKQVYRKQSQYSYDGTIPLAEYVKEHLPKFVNRLKDRAKDDGLTKALSIIDDPESDEGITSDAIHERAPNVTFSDIPAQRKRAKNKRKWKVKPNGYVDFTDSHAMPFDINGHNESPEQSAILDDFRDHDLNEEDRQLLDALRVGLTKKDAAKLHGISIGAFNKKFFRAIERRDKRLDTPEKQAERELEERVQLGDLVPSFGDGHDWPWNYSDLREEWIDDAAKSIIAT